MKYGKKQFFIPTIQTNSQVTIKIHMKLGMKSKFD